MRRVADGWLAAMDDVLSGCDPIQCFRIEGLLDGGEELARTRKQSGKFDRSGVCRCRRYTS